MFQKNLDSNAGTVVPKQPHQLQQLRHGVFFCFVFCVIGFAFSKLAYLMDGYEKAMLVLLPLFWMWLTVYWKSLQLLTYSVLMAVLLGIYLYAGDIGSAQFGILKYIFASQTALMWMGVLVLLSTLCYWKALFFKSERISISLFKTGNHTLWLAVWAGWVALGMRWYESYLISPDLGRIPISNLYEVFILFILITALLYLYYEQKHNTPALGGFVLLVVCASLAFLYWYSTERQAHTITGLVPALQSWWMKIHVPANFVGYGAFSVAAMVAFASLLKQYRHNTKALIGLFFLAGLLFLEPLVFRKKIELSSLPVYAGFAFVLAAAIVACRRVIVRRLPSLKIMDMWMQQSIALGFLFFTLATILGAFWAADAWGAYWQWDPKETWAFIVWLNYAAWLHLRLVKQWRGAVLAWWALMGLLLTGFAFLGVNMFLSGLHSYGEL